MPTNAISAATNQFEVKGADSEDCKAKWICTALLVAGIVALVLGIANSTFIHANIPHFSLSSILSGSGFLAIALLGFCLASRKVETSSDSGDEKQTDLSDEKTPVSLTEPSGSKETFLNYFHIYGRYPDCPGSYQTNAPIHEGMAKPLRIALDQLKSYPPFYEEVIRDLASKEFSLTPTQCKYALETVLGMAIIERNATMLSQISDEDKRNKKINELTQMGAERSFAPGTEPAEILVNIQKLVERLKDAYAFDKQRNDTLAFFRDGFIGPPCFNGRLITLAEYATREQGNLSQSHAAYKLPYDDRAMQYLEWMYQCLEQSHLPEKDPPGRSVFRDFLDSLAKDNESLREELVTGGMFDRIYERACQFWA